MVDHLCQAALSYHLVNWVRAEKEYIVHRSDRFEQCRMVDVHSRREHKCQKCLDDLQGDRFGRGFRMASGDGMHDKVH